MVDGHKAVLETQKMLARRPHVRQKAFLVIGGSGDASSKFWELIRRTSQQDAMVVKSD